MKHEITISIDDENLKHYTDEFLLQCWHVAQANPAPFADRAADELAESVGREIIRRWLKCQEPALWNRQGRHYFWDIARQAGKWDEAGVWKPHAAHDMTKLENA